MVDTSVKSNRVLSVFLLAMLNVSVMASLRNLPLIAEYQLQAIFFFLVIAAIFLVPCALVSAELATGWPKDGGIYIWIREAFGDRWGFFAIWMQWVHNVAWYPVILSFVATTFSQAFFPHLSGNTFYVLAVVLFSFWGMTALNCMGIKTSSWFSTIGTILGTIVPGAVIIGLGMTWLGLGKPTQFSFTAANLVPALDDITNLVFLAGLFLSFAGLEVTAALAGNVKNPKKNYPRAILLAALITFSLVMLGSIAISIVVPKEEISLLTGFMDALKVFLSSFNLTWLLPVFALLLILGAVAEVNSWIIGPVRGLYATCRHGNLPPVLQKLNSKKVPVNLLLIQAIIVTVVSFVFLLMPSLNVSFWILSALSAQIYLVMYFMMFAAALRLRYTKPHIPRTYEIPYKHKHKGMWFIATVGMIASTFAIVLGYVPPKQLFVGNIWVYEGFLFLGMIIFSAIPIIIHEFRKPEWIHTKTLED